MGRAKPAGAPAGVYAVAKSSSAFKTISEVSDELGVPKHVLRFWEAKFTQIKPMKRGGGRRFYRPEDVELLRGIQHLLHQAGYTIKGAQKILRERDREAVKALASEALAQRAMAPSPKQGKAPATTPAAAQKTALAGRPQGQARSRLSDEQASIIRKAIAELEECLRLIERRPRTSDIETAQRRA
jgi:DNA-binding transcriptional MerR regulator